MSDVDPLLDKLVQILETLTNHLRLLHWQMLVILLLLTFTLGLLWGRMWGRGV